jgi:hypothetical protein
MRKKYERLFIESFIAALSCIYIFKIPFANKDFRDGVKKLGEYLHEEMDPGIYTKIKSIFAVKPCEGNFQIFKQSLEKENGSYISFNNPKWVSANITISPFIAEEILEKAELGIEKQLFIQAAKRFCEGAGILN